MSKLSEFGVSLKLPLLEMSGKWTPDDSERVAAWEMYVELVTRVSVVRLGEDEGSVREALSSLYELFGITRSILKAHGPAVAQPKSEGSYSFGYIAVAVLNGAVRPLLACWHSRLADWESGRPTGKSATEWEREWKAGDGTDLNKALRSELETVRIALKGYADLLALVADVPSLIIAEET